MENQQVSEGAAPAEAAGAWLDKNSESYERVAYLLQLALPSGKPVTDVAVWKIEHPPEALSHFGALAAPRDPDPAVAALRPDRTPFAAHLDAAQGLVATFDNLGHDATLIAPCGAVPSGCAHLASWCRTAPPEEQHAFWRAVGQAVQAWWRRSDAPLWLSTSGLGVHWLHVRLDERPKYITHRPYRTLAR